jgi:hypothetical protein
MLRHIPSKLFFRYFYLFFSPLQKSLTIIAVNLTNLKKNCSAIKAGAKIDTISFHATY